MKKKVLISILIICISIVGILTFKNIQMNKQIKDQKERIENQQKLEEQKKLDVEKEKIESINKEYFDKIERPIDYKTPTIGFDGLNSIGVASYDLTNAIVYVFVEINNEYYNYIINADTSNKIDKQNTLDKLEKLSTFSKNLNELFIKYKKINSEYMKLDNEDQFKDNENFDVNIDNKQYALNINEFNKRTEILLPKIIKQINETISKIENNSYNFKNDNGEECRKWIGNHSLEYKEKQLYDNRSNGVEKLEEYLNINK